MLKLRTIAVCLALPFTGFVVASASCAQQLNPLAPAQFSYAETYGFLALMNHSNAPEQPELASFTFLPIIPEQGIDLVEKPTDLPEASQNTSEGLSPAEPGNTPSKEELEYLDQTVFDLFLSDKAKGVAFVEFTDKWFRIDSMEEVFDQLPEVKDTEKLKQLLSGWIPLARKLEGFGSVELELNTFRLVIKIDPGFLVGKEFSLSDRIPDPQNKFALQQRLQAAVSSDSSESTRSALGSRTIASFGKVWLESNATYVQEPDENEVLELGELSLTGIAEQIELSLGLLETEGQFLASSSEYAGLQMRTAESVFLDQELLRGSRVEVFIPSRARVEFFKGKRLIDVQVLNFGLQEIDTSNFPQGSYDVDIVITEGNGQVTRERSFFTKTGRLAVRSRPVFYLQGGVLRERAEVDSIPVGQAGVVWRATGILETSLSVSHFDDTQIGEAKFTGLYRDVLFSGGYLSSTDSDSAVTAAINANHEGLFWDASITEALSGFDESDVDSESFEDIIEDFGQEDDQLDIQSNLSSTRSNRSSSIGYAAGPLTLRLSYGESESLVGSTTFKRRTFGPRANWTIYSTQRTSVRFSGSYFDTDKGLESSGSVLFSRRFGRWTIGTTLNVRGTEQEDEVALVTVLDFDGKRFTDEGFRLKATNEARNRRGEESNTEIVNSVDGELTNKYFESRAFLRDSRRSGESSSSLGLTGETSFVLSQDGSALLSSPESSDSLFIAEVQSDSTESEIEILVNDQVKESIKAGEIAVIGLEPFRMYRVGIRPTERADLVTYENTVHEVALFPGNILRRTWSVQKVFIGLGRIVDESGLPISGKRVRGFDGFVFTETDGTFQAEMTGAEKLSMKLKNKSCEIVLPKAEEVDYFFDFGDLVCKTKSPDAR